ncbi:taurine dioxygenase [Siccirubricoccus deserti]|nr:taurine dioxygenase [Siccirubricoccus deserti]
MDIRPLHSLFAVEVTGLDLGGPVDAATLEVLYDLFLEHAVLLFRGQSLTVSAQADFGRRLAALEAPLLARGSQLPPALRVMSEPRPGAAPSSAAWHADKTHDAEPALACIVHSLAAAPVASSIGFADQRAALALLPPGLRRRAEELRAEHRHSSRMAEHPVVRSHPVTGEAALFVNPAFTSRILNLPEAESDRLLVIMFAAATAASVSWQHDWQPGDLLLWDNRAVLHTGASSAVLQRIRIEGDRPTGTHALDMPWVMAG